MKTLYLRIWLTVVAALALFALASGWLVQRHLEQERARSDAQMAERFAAWGELIQGSLPEAWDLPEVQAAALTDWSRRLRLPMALDNPAGVRIGASESFLRRETEGRPNFRPIAIRLVDGRTLWLVRPGGRRGRDQDSGEPSDRPEEGRPSLARAEEASFRLGVERNLFKGLPWQTPPDWPSGLGTALLLGLLFLAIAASAWPVVRSLTRRLERLKAGVDTFGGGALNHRVAVDGRDEVAALAQSFNQAAARIEALVQTHRRLLANASHELRSPLARLRMAAAMLVEAGPAQQQALREEIDTNVSELDALVEEILLSSRLEAAGGLDKADVVALQAVVTEEASRHNVPSQVPPVQVWGQERLLRRAVRNLIENAKRYAGQEVEVAVLPSASASVRIEVRDRGPGVPLEQREKIFEPFYRMPGHAEREGGVGLGLALVRQIAISHHGTVHCEAREGGGSIFVISLPIHSS